MSQKNSGYQPIPLDMFATPAWVTEALLKTERFSGMVWEPASGEGGMVRVLRGYDIPTYSTDISDGPCHDFLAYRTMRGMRPLADDTSHSQKAIITNPPYSNGLAEKFVRHALDLTKPVKGKVAMLLPLAWDSAKGRRDLFADHPAFKVKYTLTKRILWANLEQKKNGPSQNHMWAIWDWSKNPNDPPVAGYLP